MQYCNRNMIFSIRPWQNTKANVRRSTTLHHPLSSRLRFKVCQQRRACRPHSRADACVEMSFSLPWSGRRPPGWMLMTRPTRRTQRRPSKRWRRTCPGRSRSTLEHRLFLLRRHRFPTINSPPPAPVFVARDPSLPPPEQQARAAPKPRSVQAQAGCAPRLRCAHHVSTLRRKMPVRVLLERGFSDAVTTTWRQQQLRNADAKRPRTSPGVPALPRGPTAAFQQSRRAVQVAPACRGCCWLMRMVLHGRRSVGPRALVQRHQVPAVPARSRLACREDHQAS